MENLLLSLYNKTDLEAMTVRFTFWAPRWDILGQQSIRVRRISGQGAGIG
jgi:hypothetical protein